MKMIQHSLRVWAGVGLAALCALTGNAATVKTLGGGPNESSLSKSGSTDGDTLTQAKFNQPWAVATSDTAGTTNDLFVADRNNKRVRRISAPGSSASVTTTFATGINAANGVAVASNLVFAIGQKDGSVHLYNNSGTEISRYGGFVQPTAIAVDFATNIYVAQESGEIIRLTLDGNAELIASGFNRPRGIAVLRNGYLAVTEVGAHAVSLVDPLTGTVTLLAGGNGPGFLDGDASVAKFNQPHGIAEAPTRTLVVADRMNHRIRLIATNGAVTTLYGVSAKQFTRPFAGWRDGDVSEAVGREPIGVAVRRDGTLFVTERYWNLVRQVTGAPQLSINLNTNVPPGGGNTNAQENLPAPTFSPNSGYYPMGVTITVTSTVPVYYTTDGTEPTTNSAQVQLDNFVGTIRFTETLRDLTSLRLKAIVGPNSSPTVFGVPSSANTIGIPRDVSAGIGSTIVVPVVINAATSNRIRSVQFRVEVTPLNGGPSVLSQFRATSISSNDFVLVATAAKENTIATYNASPYSIGPTRGLVVSAIGTNSNFDVQHFAVAAMLVIPIDPNSIEGHTYRIEILQPSATSDGQQALVPIQALPPRTITVSNIPYLVGDSSPGHWYNAGDFGDGDLQNDDVNNVFYASHGVRAPYPYTDVFNAMDAYPPEETGAQGGDGVIDSFDLNVILARALRMPGTFNWTRHWSDGGLLMSDPVEIPYASRAAAKAAAKAANAPGPGTVWLRHATLGAVNLPYAIPGETYNVPVWLRVAPGCSVAGLGMRVAVVADGGAPAMGRVTFTPTLGTDNFIVGNAVAPNEALCTWLMVPSPAFAPGLQGSNVLGYVTFKVPQNAAPGQTYSIRFMKLSGGADMNTPYEFEGVPGSVAVQRYDVKAEMISDDWKQYFFSTNTANAEMSVDADGDGASNAQEYFEGTDPTDANSRLTLDKQNITTESGPAVQLSWLSASLKRYTIERGPSASGPWSPLATNVAGDGYVKQVNDNAPSDSAPFYRIRVQP